MFMEDKINDCHTKSLKLGVLTKRISELDCL